MCVRSLQHRWWAAIATAFLVPTSFAGTLAVTGMFEAAIPFAVIALAATGATFWYSQKLLQQRIEYYLGELPGNLLTW